jgi:hypothetical protein
MIKVKEFYTELYDLYNEDEPSISKHVDEEINEWLKEHQNIEIIDVRYQVDFHRTYNESQVLLIYKEKESE